MPREFGVPEDVIEAVLTGKSTLSAYSPFLSPIHGKHVIGVNAAFLLGSWVDIAFFGDGNFYFKNKNKLEQFPKLKVSCNLNLRDKKNVRGVKFLGRDGNHPMGLSSRPGYVSWNLNSGGAAISMAAQMGVTKMYLLGFDMRLSPEGFQHWHSQYRKGVTPHTNPAKLPFGRHLRCFPMIANEAKRQGIEIINVSPDSAIKSFPKVSLKEVLG